MVNVWHGMLVTKYRKAAKVPYPNAYAPESEAAKSMEKYQFNCAQRSHANFIENYTNFLVAMAIAGLGNAKAAAAFGAVFLLGRIVYAQGYVRPQRDGGKGRLTGAFQYIGVLGNLGLASWTLWKSFA